MAYEVPSYVTDSITQRWNFDMSGPDVIVCKNEHEKNDTCTYVTMPPIDIVKMLDGYREIILCLYQKELDRHVWASRCVKIQSD